MDHEELWDGHRRDIAKLKAQQSHLAGIELCLERLLNLLESYLTGKDGNLPIHIGGNVEWTSPEDIDSWRPDAAVDLNTDTHIRCGYCDQMIHYDVWKLHRPACRKEHSSERP